MKKQLFFLCMLVLPFAPTASASPTSPTAHQDSSVLIIDGIRFEAVVFRIDAETRTATAELTLTNVNDKPRELKINVYGTQLVDNDRNAHYFSSIAMGRVLMRFSDKQNYLHYFLQPDTAVKLTVTAEVMPTATKGIELVKIVFEDGSEEGRFLDAYLSAPTEAETD